LIELLVVIAIIAILTAILLPVFQSVRENSRQSVAISNLKDIQQKMEQFKLDNHRYPDVLFGYAIPTAAGGYVDSSTNMSNALAKAQDYDKKNGTHQALICFPGLYPAYIKDPEEFKDPNNNLADNNSATPATPPLNTYAIAPFNAADDTTLRAGDASVYDPAVYGPGAAVPTKRSYFIADAYDSSPVVTGVNKVDPTPGNFLVRYQLAHLATACSSPGSSLPKGCDPSIDLTDAATAARYKRQLRWQNPPADSVVTVTPYHVQNADKVLVMFQNGTVKKFRAEDFLGPSGADNTTNFWQVTP
jgi:type II secretory pathway pseudopilin PulG